MKENVAGQRTGTEPNMDKKERRNICRSGVCISILKSIKNSNLPFCYVHFITAYPFGVNTVIFIYYYF